MSIKTAGKALGRYLLILLAAIIVVPLIFSIIGTPSVANNIGMGSLIFRDLMIPFLIFRFGLYACVYAFYKPITLHFTSKLMFSEEDTEYALTRRNSIVISIIVFEALVTSSLLYNMV